MSKQKNTSTKDATKKVPVYGVRMMTDDEWNRLAYKNYLQRKSEKNE